MDTPPPADKPSARRRSRVAATLRALVRTRVTAGLIVVLPIYVTYVVVKFLFGAMRDASRWVVLALLESKWFHKYVWQLELVDGQELDLETLLAQYPALDWGIAVFSVLLTIFLLYAIGIFAANMVGRRVIELFDRIVERVPLVKTVYRGLKQILASFSGDATQSFQRVALIPFPHENMRCVGFVTNTFKDSITGDELCSVFISTTPNPTTGYLQILKRSEITELDWSVEEAIRTIMSGGILKPDFLTIVPNKQLPADAPKGVGPTPLPAPTPPTDEDPPELNA